MSEDAQLAHACPHFIRYERANISGNREIFTLSPISSSNLLSLRLNGIEVGSEGYFSPSETVFPSLAPYRFTETTKTLVVETEIQSQTITFPKDKIFLQKDLISFLNSSFTLPIVAEAYSSSIKLTNQRKSDTLNLSGTALSKLGYTSKAVKLKNRKRYESWVLSKRIGGGYKIIFKKEMYFNGVADISYLTEKDNCRRCSGTGVENDFRYSEKGDIKTIKDHNLLYQSISKVLLTEISSNPYHIWYGSNAMTLIGRKVSSSVVQSLKSSVRDALSSFKNVQDQQASVQNLTLKERLRRVINIEVSTIGEDETSYLVSVVVESMSSEQVSINIVFAVPGSIPLDGDLR